MSQDAFALPAPQRNTIVGYLIDVPQPSITLRPEYGIKVRLKQIADSSNESDRKAASIVR